MWVGVGGQRDRVIGETTVIDGYSGGDVKTWCSGNFLEPMRVILARTPLLKGGYRT